MNFSLSQIHITPAISYFLCISLVFLVQNIVWNTPSGHQPDLNWTPTRPVLDTNWTWTGQFPQSGPHKWGGKVQWTSNGSPVGPSDIQLETWGKVKYSNKGTMSHTGNGTDPSNVTSLVDFALVFQGLVFIAGHWLLVDSESHEWGRMSSPGEYEHLCALLPLRDVPSSELIQSYTFAHPGVPHRHHTRIVGGPGRSIHRQRMSGPKPRWFQDRDCCEDRRQGPRNKHQPQSNQRPSLAEIDKEIGREGLGLGCIENRWPPNTQAGGRQWYQQG